MKPCKTFLPAVSLVRRWRLLWPAAAAVLALAMPVGAVADDDGGPEQGLAALANTLSAEALAAAHARGIERHDPHSQDTPGVILWDETGSVRRTSTTQSKGDGNEQAISASLGAGAGTVWSGGQPMGFDAVPCALAVAGSASSNLANAVGATATILSPR